MQRFTDAFGMVLRPLILLVRSDIPRDASSGAYHVMKKFHGQSSPLLSMSSLRLKDIDWTLFDKLVVRWRRKFSAAEPEWVRPCPIPLSRHGERRSEDPGRTRPNRILVGSRGDELDQRFRGTDSSRPGEEGWNIRRLPAFRGSKVDQ